MTARQRHEMPEFMSEALSTRGLMDAYRNRFTTSRTTI